MKYYKSVEFYHFQNVKPSLHKVKDPLLKIFLQWFWFGA